MNTGAQMVFMAVDLLVSIHDFYNHLILSLQARGYEDWVGGESNLLITRYLVGRITNASYTGFQYQIDRVAEYLASNGV